MSLEELCNLPMSLFSDKVTADTITLSAFAFQEGTCAHDILPDLGAAKDDYDLALSGSEEFSVQNHWLSLGKVLSWRCVGQQYEIAQEKRSLNGVVRAGPVEAGPKSVLDKQRPDVHPCGDAARRGGRRD